MNLPANHRDQHGEGSKTVELMYNELMKRFSYGSDFKSLHPIDDMEITFDQELDAADIKELITA